MFGRKAKQDVKVVVLRKDITRLRIHEWRADTRLVTEARRVNGDATFRMMMDVVANESPANIALALGTSTEDRAAQQARTEGFNMALDYLRLLATYEEPKQPFPEATFEPTETNL